MYDDHNDKTNLPLILLSTDIEDLSAFANV